MFEKAAKQKLRFNFKGQCTTEDLWDLPLKDLASVFKDFNAQLKVQKEDSLMIAKTSEDKVLMLKIDIIRHIFGVKLQEAFEQLNDELSKLVKGL